MSRPADVPEDLARIASVLVDDMHLNPDIRFSGILAGPTVERVIAEALAAERERAAKVAEEFPQVSSLHNYGRGLSRIEEAEIRTATLIAQDIRAGATHAN